MKLKHLSGLASPIAIAIAMALSTGLAAPPTQQAYVKASNTGSPDWFGFSTGLSGDTIIVGAPLEDSDASGVNGDQLNNRALNSGAAYVLVRQGTNWGQQAFLKASNTSTNDRFGSAVAVSGDTVVIGAVSESSAATGINGKQSDYSAPNAGAVYVFVRQGTSWNQQAYLKASNTRSGDHFGSAVAISGDTIVVGAPFEDNNATGVNGSGVFTGSYSDRGATYVFVRDGTNWTQQAYLKGSNTDPFDNFGRAVAISADTIIIGASGEDSNAAGVNGSQTNNTVVQSGAAYIFARNGTNWSQQAYLKSSSPQIEGLFGFSVAVSADTAAVAALGEAVNGRSAAGAAYVFVRNGTNWSPQTRLIASNNGARDQFGWSMALSGNTVVVGAPFEDSNTTGINGDESNETGYESGASYVFVRRGTSWTQQAYLKASNTGPAAAPNETGDSFGMSVSISGDTVLVGAVTESSSATGINGNQYDNGAGGAGAAYVYCGVGVGPQLALSPGDGAGPVIRCSGSPEITYRLQRASGMIGAWETITSCTVPASGWIDYQDKTAPPGQAFYRAVTP